MLNIYIFVCCVRSRVYGVLYPREVPEDPEGTGVIALAYLNFDRVLHFGIRLCFRL